SHAARRTDDDPRHGAWDFRPAAARAAQRAGVDADRRGVLRRLHHPLPGARFAMSDLRRENRNMTWKLLAIAAGSFGFGFALVPLYNVLCSVTGYGDQTRLLRKVSAIERPDMSRTVTVRSE